MALSSQQDIYLNPEVVFGSGSERRVLVPSGATYYRRFYVWGDLQTGPFMKAKENNRSKKMGRGGGCVGCFL